MNKRAFLVLGPESSGTRLMTKVLIAAGCFGDGGHEQRLDSANPEAPLIVWRRSLPHGKRWPKLPTMFDALSTLHYQVTALVMSRDWHACALSQVTEGHVVDVAQGLDHIRRANGQIFWDLVSRDVPFEIVNYEALVRRPHAYLAHLLARHQLAMPEGVYIYDGNVKYYEPDLPTLEEMSQEMML